jgi:thiamine-phosphate diphosphorylase/hydroxyethylthiazole kinase
VVSAIISANDPAAAAQELLHLIKGSNPFCVTVPKAPVVKDVTALVRSVPSIVKKVGRENPLTHNMTNFVVQNIAANVALCM